MTSSDLRPQLPAAAAAALRSGNKIEAIKIVRAELRIGLKEAKDLVDASDIAASKASPKSPLMTGESSRPAIWLWIVVIAITLGAWYWWK